MTRCGRPARRRRPIREQLAQYTAAAIASTWASSSRRQGIIIRAMSVTRIMALPMKALSWAARLRGNRLRKFRNCRPQTAAQMQTEKACAAAMNEVFQQRWATIAASQVSLSTPFFIVLVFWLFIVFLCLGLSTPLNALSAITISLSAIALASALFVVADLNGLYSGVFVISSAPVHAALAQMLAGRQ